MDRSVNKDDFMSLDGSQSSSTHSIKKSNSSLKLSSLSDSGKSALELQDEDDQKQGLKLPLYNKHHE